MENIKRFFREEEGLEMSEYALMGAIICIAVAAAVLLLRNAIGNALNAITGVIEDNIGAGAGG